MTLDDLIKIIEDKVPPHISFIIFLKFHFSNNRFFHILSFFFRFIGILILCANFSLKLNEVQNKSLSYYLRYLTASKILELIKITNTTYIIISIIIFILFWFRVFSYIMIMRELKSKQNLSKCYLILFRFLNINEHLVYLLYPFILEFLAQIIFSFIFPDTFIFVKDKSKILNILVTILIIGYNIDNYFFMILINKPFDSRKVGIKYRYSSYKFWLLFSLQNISLIHNIQIYFSTDEQIKLFSYIYLIFFGLIFLILFILSLQKYNYQNITNSFISFMASFCFFSITIKCIFSLCGYSFKTTHSIISANIFIFFISLYFTHLITSISNSFLFKKAMNELFKVNKDISNNKIYDCFIYVIEILKEIKNNQKSNSAVNLLNHIFKHQNKCSLNNCKCKLIQLIPHGYEYDKNYTQNLLDRISFLIESTFINIDFSQNYELCLILSEHYFYIKDNPIMAYSFIQTLLIYNMDNLSITQFLNCYEILQKYIETMLNYKYRLKMVKKNPNADLEQFAHDNLLENKFRQTFLIYENIRKIQEIMNNYCQVFVDIIKKRNIIEESVKIQRIEDTGEILSIDFTYLTEDKIEEIIKILKNESNLYSDLFNEIDNLKTKKFPVEFYYKVFLFWDIFMEGKLNEKLIPIFFSFSRDHNFYSNNINPNIFIVLRQRFIDINNNGKNLFYCIFKYSKGMTISYFSEPLSQILGYLHSELIDKNINNLMPNEIIKSHDNIILHYLITKQNRVYKGINNKLFNKKGLLYNGSMNGSALLGLGKYLLIMINIRIIENENEYLFYYNQNLNLISFSNNFGNHFSLDLDLVSKCNLNLLSLFNISQELLKKKLKEIKNEISNYKSFLEAKTEEIYSKKLYKHGNKTNSIKYKLFEELENQNFEDSENSHINNKLLNAQRRLEHIYNNKFKERIPSIKLKFKRPKSLIFNNYDKFVNNNDKIDIHDKYYKLLLDSFYSFKNQYSQNKFQGNIIYNILANIHILYDIPFITINIKEQYDFSIKELEVEKPIIKTNLNLIPKNSDKNISYFNNNRQDSNSQQTISSVGIDRKIKNYEQMIKFKKNFLEKYINKIVIFSIFCVLVVYIIILIYQLTVINNIYNIFIAFYYNYIQRDKLVNLHSTIISGAFFFPNLINYGIFANFHIYTHFIQKRAEEYNVAYHTFYQKYIHYRFDLGKDLSAFYIKYNFSQIHVFWEEYIIQSNYLEESEIMVYQTKSSGLNDKQNDINYDLKLFFNSNYTNYPKEELKSLYIQILFYFSKNMQNTFMEFFSSIQEEIYNTQENYSKKNKILSTIIEVLGFLLNMITFISAIYFLKKSNINLYKSIINLFIDFTQEGNYTFKNSYNNYLMGEKLTRLKFLLNNFSVEAIDKFNKKINTETINKNNLEENYNNDHSLIIKPRSSSKKQIHKIRKIKNIAVKSNENKINITNNNSLTISKSQNKLINVFSVNIISKLNQNIIPDKSNLNASTKDVLYIDSSSQNIKSVNNNKKNLGDEDSILTKEIIYEKLKILETKITKFYKYFCIFLSVILFVYLIIKLLQTFRNFNNSSELFVDYSIVTFEYSLIMNYFNNFKLLLENRPIGREDYMRTMQLIVENQFKQSEEVKKKSIKNYPKISKLFDSLNNGNDSNEIREILCKDYAGCHAIFSSDYSIIKNGVDVGLRTIAHEIYNMLDDYLKLKNKLNTYDELKKYFLNEEFIKIDLSLNFLLTEVEDRCAEMFILEADDLIANFKNIIISLNIFIIIFLAIISIAMVFLIINRITLLSNLIEKSSMRVCISINLLKEKNFGVKSNSVNLL